MSVHCLRLLTLVALCNSCAFAANGTAYSVTLDEGTGASIKSPEKCNADIGNGGGDLVEAGVRYRGKCEGAGIAPVIENKGGMRYLKFATDPWYRGKTRTRSELALTTEWFPFGKPVYMGFRIRVPGEVDKTDAFFYMMQFWQCASASPVAGLRMSRGYSHRVNFMTRGHSRAASMATYDLDPNTWTSFVIKAIVDPGGKKGSFVVWKNPGEKPEQYNGPYGYAESGACRDRTEPPQKFRIKFGIYKGNEDNKRYEVHYDDVRIGNSFDSVSPWVNAHASGG
jgi:hypothetical protein